MRPILLLLLCGFNCNMYAQPVPASLQDFTREEVKFNSAGVSLEGTVFKPRHPHTAIVLVHGSGRETRMLEMASFLAGRGIAVLSYDKRGVAKSGGVYAGPEVGTNNISVANLDLLASDASAACNSLLENLPAYKGPLGLMGFSQAGWIIPMAAAKNPKVNFMVVFSGPLVSTLEQLRFQFYTNGNARFWEAHTEAEAREHIRSDPDRYQFEATDPRDALSGISIPGLWLFGGKDVQVPVGLSLERLDALKALGKPYEYRLFPEYGHHTAIPEGQGPLETAVEWIKDLP